MVSVTKLGGQQRRIIGLIGHRGALTWRQLLLLGKLDECDLRKLLRTLVAAGVLVHEWNKDGRAVYRLPERKADVS
jgi:hypothetical protein